MTDYFFNFLEEIADESPHLSGTHRRFKIGKSGFLLYNAGSLTPTRRIRGQEES
jgi:hypothetical protein